jgi:hypothetical protein
MSKQPFSTLQLAQRAVELDSELRASARQRADGGPNQNPYYEHYPYSASIASETTSGKAHARSIFAAIVTAS